MTHEEMDITDTKQQHEIDDLKKKAEQNETTDTDQAKALEELRRTDVRHDDYISILKVIIAVLVVGMFLNWFLMFSMIRDFKR